MKSPLLQIVILLALSACGSNRNFIHNEVTLGPIAQEIMPTWFDVKQGDKETEVITKLKAHVSSYDTILLRSHRIVVMRPRIVGTDKWGDLAYGFKDDTLARAFISTSLPNSWAETSQLYFALRSDLITQLGPPTYDTAIVSVNDTLYHGVFGRVWGKLHAVWQGEDSAFSEINIEPGILYFGVRRW